MQKRMLLSSIISLMVTQGLMGGEVVNKQISLDEAISIALQHSEKNIISKYDLEIAQAQYKQAMSANFPSLDLEIGAVKRDEDVINITKSELALPDNIISLLAGVAMEQIIANPSLISSFDTTNFGTIPLNFETTVMGDETLKGSLKITYPLYTGGKISAIQKQARLGKEIAAYKDERTKQEIIFDVKKYYHGALLAKHVAELVNDTAQRMGALNDLTKELYEGGSENVKKTDYYRTNIAASMLKAMSGELFSNAKLAKSALVFAMGVEPTSKVTLKEVGTTKEKLIQPLEHFIAQAYQNNKQLLTLNKAIDVYDAKIDEAKSGYKPNVALFGSLDKMDNNFDGGMSNAQNDNSWTVGIGAQWNLFNGFRTTSTVSEVKLNKMKLKEQQHMFKNGLALQVKKAYLDSISNTNQVNILKQTVKTSEKNRDLNTRAYQADMVETKDVVEAQITEAQIKAKYFQVLHQQALSQANLELVAGK